MDKIDIPKELYKEILNYCKLNDIKDINKFMVKILTSGFTIAKFGVQPNTNKETHRDGGVTIVETEVIPKDNKVVKKDPKIKDDLYGEG